MANQLEDEHAEAVGDVGSGAGVLQERQEAGRTEETLCELGEAHQAWP